MAEIKGGQIVYDVIINKITGEANIKLAEKSLTDLGNRASQTADKVDKAGKSVEKSSTGFGRIKDIAIGLGVYDLAVKGVQAVVGFFKDSTKAAEENALSIKGLALAMQNNGQFTRENLKDLTEMSDKLELNTNFTEEQINANSQYLISQNLTTEQIKATTPALLDMAQAMGTDVQGASDVMLKSIQGGSAALGKYFKNVDESTLKTFESATATERLAIFQKLAAERFNGTAEASQTFGNKVSKVFGNFQESVGYALKVGLEPFKEAFSGFTGDVGVSAEMMTRFQQVVYGVAQLLATTIKVVFDLGKATIAYGSNVLAVGKVIFQVFKPGLEVIKGVAGAISNLADGNYKGAFDSLKGGALSAFDELKNLPTNLKNSMGEASKTIQSNNKEIFSGIKSAVKDTVSGVGEAFSQSKFKEITKETTRDMEAQKLGADQLNTTNSKLGKSFGDLKEKQQANQKATEENAKAQEQIEKKLNDVRLSAKQTAEELKNNLTEAYKKFSESITNNFAETDKKLAEIVVSAEQKAKELKDKIALGGDTTEAQKELAVVQKTLDARVGYEQRKADEIALIRKKLTDAGLDPNKLNLDALNQQASLEKQIEDQRAFAKLTEFQQEELRSNQKLLKLANDFILEAQLIQQKIEKQKAFEDDLTNFVTSENLKRKQSVEAFANASILKYGQMAQALRDTISLQSQLSSISTNASKPQFHDGGYVGPAGGEVHPGEFVVPAGLVAGNPDLIAMLDKARGQTNNITINGANTNSGDLRSISEEMLWRLGRM